MSSSRRPGLGQGLGALLPTETQATPPSKSGVMEVAIKSIVTNPHQPRTEFNKEELADLAASIKEHGIIQPLIITASEEGDDQYTLIAGERRLQASQLAGLEKVPAILREASEQDMLLLALIENVQRADLSALETAEAYRHLAEEFNFTHEQIAQRVGKSRVAVSNTLKLLKAAPAVREALASADSNISEGHVRAMGNLPLHTQTALVESIDQYEFSVRQTEKLVQYLRELPMDIQISEIDKAIKKKLYFEIEEKEAAQPAKPGTAPAPDYSPELTELQERLRTQFSTKVNLKHADGEGTITLFYYSDEELNTLLEKLLDN